MRVIRRLAHILHLSSHADDLADELRFHREMLECDLIRRGRSPQQARDETRRAMGNETAMRERSREVWLWPALDALRQDLVVTTRNLARNPTFTAGVVITLALGIGANAAMFSLVDRLLFRPPARMIDPSNVHRVYLYRTARGVERETGGIYARYMDVANGATTISAASGIVLQRLAVGTGDDTRVRNIGVVSAAFFGFFDAPPALGRYFDANEDAPPVPAPVAVISHGLWTSRFGARRDVLGATVKIDAVTYTVIGVAPEDFVGLWPYRPPAAFIPVTTFAASRGHPDWATTYGTAFGLGILVRAQSGVSPDALNADLGHALQLSYQKQYAGQPGGAPLGDLRPRAVAASVLAERGPNQSSITRATRWLSGVTLIVLLIACANVVNLMLSRTIRRRREIAVRVTLGVSRPRLLGHLLVEGLVLALLGGAAGLAVALWAGNVLRAMFLPGSEAASLLGDPRTLIFDAAVALVVGVVTALVPMAQVGRGTLIADLKSGARDGAPQRSRLRTAMLLVQGALSVVLLVGAGLFVRSLNHVRDVRLGFDADSVLLVDLGMRDARLDSASTVALRMRLLETVKTVPGVASATLQESVPFAGSTSWPIFVSGIDSVRALGTFDFNTVSPEYFQTMGTRIVRGRAFTNTDVAGAPRVAVLGQSMANILWPKQDPIGRCLRVGADTMPCTYVVGVAEDIHSQSIDTESKLFFYYLPALQWHPEEGGLFVRARGDVQRLVEPVRKRLQREMPGAAYVTVRPLAEIVDATLRDWVVGAKVFAGFGALALLLAAVGLYSVIAYNVTHRNHELGVRLAMGATRTGIIRLVVADALRFALAGIAIGALVALASAKWIEPLLFRRSARDPAVFAFVAAVLLGVAIVASLVPALRAANVDPRTALQAD